VSEASLTLPIGVRGRLVDIDGHAVRVYDSGAGNPPVVFEAGATGTLDSFNLVRNRLEPDVRVIGYDRPGLGFSELHDGARDRRPSETAARLARLLDLLGVHEPVVLVGHSLGGLYCRAFAAQSPARVRAIVLADPSHERMWSVQPPRTQRLIRAQITVMSRAFGVLSAVGAAPVVQALMPRKLIGRLGLPPSEALALRRSYGTRTALRTMSLEFAQLGRCLQQMQTLVPATTVPLTILSAGKGRMDPELAGVQRWINGLHADLVTTHEGGWHRVIEHSGHYMPWDAPDAIADAVLAMTRQ
jgi:pimeloyl-ACP methyl ester carboxylesterase